ncbi:cytochrome P450 [Bosea sp. BH3]|uniref:cytochrome P450 n=1 Tax=Bosea sp. BH3 TaxID=2871701 RepID=UPI0021CB241C|nr:cytochrome P450 [Bosea sp. BH3]MCU4182188.1 cytochrome P450 [Bosea sp. BH3]
MFKFDPKYFAGVKKAQAELPLDGPVPPFDIERMRSRGFLARAFGYLVEHPDWWLGFLRQVFPRLRAGRFLLLTRNSDVSEVLRRQADFETPYGPEMTEFSRGTNFILGMTDGEDYQRLKSVILAAFPPGEVEDRVRPIAAAAAKEIVDQAPQRINTRDLFCDVSSIICRDYFGLTFNSDREFAEWGMALSTLFFGDPTASPTVRELAIAASREMHAIIDLSIDRALGGGGADTPVGRLADAMNRGRISRAEVQASLLGMITGFGPTTLLAGCNCLDVVLSRGEMQAEVKAAIDDRDDQRLDKAIVEAMRFKPIWISPWRYARTDQTIGTASGRPYTIKGDTVIWPATRSAMFDGRAVSDPWQFKPGRPKQDSMIFGHGIHECIGAVLARVQTAECFRALFSRAGARRAKGRTGRLKRLGAYPGALFVEFENVGLQSMVTVIVPVRAGAKKERIEAQIAQFSGPMKQQIRALGTIHFASMSVIEAAPMSADVPNLHLLLELSGDGSNQAVLSGIAKALGGPLRQILADSAVEVIGPDLSAVLTKFSRDVSPELGSRSGLVFNGTPGHSVKRIRRESVLAKKALAIVERQSGRPGMDAASILQAVRDELRRTKRFSWAFIPVPNGLDDAPKGSWSALLRTLAAKSFSLTGAGAILALSVLIYWLWFGFTAPSLLHLAGRGLMALILSILGIAVLIAAAVGGVIWRLRKLEDRSAMSESAISLGALEELQRREDKDRQNHMTAVSSIKAGPLRELLLRFVFYVISITATHIFRPGFLSSIGTIHFARWVRVPGTNKLVFLSNYGGSWESYLEDFITKATAGLTGIWSNTEGFPPTRFLFLDGARDGDRFKRWARTQQIPTRFWYSAYPRLSTTLIRKNALIRQGICSASLAEARDWISLFSSTERKPFTKLNAVQRLLLPAPAPEETLEHGEIQSIAFGPMGRLSRSRMLTFSIPDGLNRASRALWLKYLSESVSFGEMGASESAMIAMFGPGALARLGLDFGLASFPPAYQQGMGHWHRSRILDDTGESCPKKWIWGSEKDPVDVVINCYARNKTILKKMIAKLVADSKAAGIELVHEIELHVDRPQPRSGKGQRPPGKEPFGFVDGVSQPVIRGSGRAGGRQVPSMHVVNAGEFLFGYRDEHGFYPPSPTVPGDSDPRGILRKISPDGSITSGPAAVRDFGRNGSFVVVRQIRQHVDIFDDYCRKAAGQVSALTQKPVPDEWVAARIVGRWKDGSSLVRSPGKPTGDAPDNHFTFGSEDPQGLRCPLGAHVRRSNPRDSLDTDLDTQIRITKRHRILRVGRNYIAADEKGATERGLLFMCLNASIERQYEFIQQTWMAAGNFHGLREEKDPLIGNHGNGSPGGRFAIPTWEGALALTGMPSFVTTRGGGYYFLPSKSALRYMQSRLGEV